MTDIQAGLTCVAHLHPGTIDDNFTVSVDALAQHDPLIMWPPIRNQCNTNIANGRNELVDAFLRHTRAEWLLMIDSDMGFARDTAERLRQAADAETRPVVGALCFKMRQFDVTAEHGRHFALEPTLYDWVEKTHKAGFVTWDRHRLDDADGGCVQVDATGAAVMLIHRSLLEGMRQAIGPHWFDHATHPKHPAPFSEDLSFCMRLSAADVPLFVHTGVETNHRKSMYLDRWMYDHLEVPSPAEPRFIVAGTGRSGSGYIAKALTAAGIPTGHEDWFNPFGKHAHGLVGESSWLSAPHLADFDGLVFHQVRDPLTVIGSLANGELFEQRSGPFFAERARFVDLTGDNLTDAVRTYVAYAEAAEAHSVRRWRVEDVDADLLRWVGSQVGVDVPREVARQAIEVTPGDFNRHGHSDLSWADLPDIEESARAEALAVEFGYERTKV